jgi:hypothetical protein
MINFRFHIASLIAVFLALALGVVMGSTVVQRAIVEGLRNRIDEVESNADDARAENRQLQREVDRLQEFSSSSAPYAVRDELTDQTVAVVAERGIDEEAVQAQVLLLQAAGAPPPGILWLESAWNLAEEGQADALRTAIGSTTRNDRALRAQALDALALRLAQGAAASPETDVLDSLAKAGFVTLEVPGDSDVAAATWPGAGARTLLLGGPGSSIAARSLSRDLTSSLVAANAPAVVGEVYVVGDGEGIAERGTWLAPIRLDEQLRAAVSTVDDIDLGEGRVAATLALADLGQGIVGHYGYGAGAESPLPVVPTAG